MAGKHGGWEAWGPNFDNVYQLITSVHPGTPTHPKYRALKYFLNPIIEGLDIVTMEGNLWKNWRGIFNPGFSANHLMNLTCSLVEEPDKFCDILRICSKDQKTFQMKDLTENLTMDVIGRFVFLGHFFGSFPPSLTYLQRQTARLSKAKQSFGRCCTHSGPLVDFRGRWQSHYEIQFYSPFGSLL